MNAATQLQDLAGLANAGQLDAARVACADLLTRDPGNAGAHCLHGMLLADMGHVTHGVEALRRALKLAPDMLPWHTKLGMLLAELGRHEEAVVPLRKAWALNRTDARTALLLALSLRHLGRLHDMIAVLGQAKAIYPDDPQIRFRFGEAMLLCGELQAGWVDIEACRSIWPNLQLSLTSKAPAWDGSDMPDATILVIPDQGNGDLIQFSRYLPTVKDRVGTVVIGRSACGASILHEFPGVDVVLQAHNQIPHHDVVIGICSLPGVFRTSITTIPRSIPFASDSQATFAWANRLDQHRPRRSGRPRVGIVWAGNPNHPNDAARSIRLRDLAPLMNEEVDLISLQVDVPEADVVTLACMGDVLELGSSVTSYRDTIAILHSIDVVITVDTSVAHLSATMGHRTWLLNALPGDWRWGSGRTSSDWYPSVTIFNQRVAGDWRYPVGQVCIALRELPIVGPKL